MAEFPKVASYLGNATSSYVPRLVAQPDPIDFSGVAELGDEWVAMVDRRNRMADNLKLVEAEGRFARDFTEKTANIDPEAPDYVEQITGISDELRKQHEEEAGFHSPEARVSFAGRTGAYVTNTIRSGIARSAAAVQERSVARRIEAENVAINVVKKDPDAYKEALDQLTAQLDVLNENIPGPVREKLARQFFETFTMAQVQGLANAGRYDEARGLIDGTPTLDPDRAQQGLSFIESRERSGRAEVDADVAELISSAGLAASIGDYDTAEALIAEAEAMAPGGTGRSVRKINAGHMTVNGYRKQEYKALMAEKRESDKEFNRLAREVEPQSANNDFDMYVEAYKKKRMSELLAERKDELMTATTPEDKSGIIGSIQEQVSQEINPLSVPMLKQSMAILDQYGLLPDKTVAAIKAGQYAEKETQKSAFAAYVASRTRSPGASMSGTSIFDRAYYLMTAQNMPADDALLAASNQAAMTPEDMDKRKLMFTQLNTQARRERSDASYLAKALDVDEDEVLLSPGLLERFASLTESNYLQFGGNIEPAREQAALELSKQWKLNPVTKRVTDVHIGDLATINKPLVRELVPPEVVERALADRARRLIENNKTKFRPPAPVKPDGDPFADSPDGRPAVYLTLDRQNAALARAGAPHNYMVMVRITGGENPNYGQMSLNGRPYTLPSLTEKQLLEMKEINAYVSAAKAKAADANLEAVDRKARKLEAEIKYGEGVMGYDMGQKKEELKLLKEQSERLRKTTPVTPTDEVMPTGRFPVAP